MKAAHGIVAILLTALGGAFVLFRSGDRDLEVELQAEKVHIGYIGCSNTIQTVFGYYRVGGRQFWPPDMRFDAGAVSNWYEGISLADDTWWNAFATLVEEFPETDTIWWQLCVRQEESTTYEEAAAILDAVRARMPGVKVFVSALPPYTQGVCEITGDEGLARAAALRDQLVAQNADVTLGPELGPMTPEHTSSDTCHLTEIGTLNLGVQMRIFFDEAF